MSKDLFSSERRIKRLRPNLVRARDAGIRTGSAVLNSSIGGLLSILLDNLTFCHFMQVLVADSLATCGPFWLDGIRDKLGVHNNQIAQSVYGVFAGPLLSVLSCPFA